MKDCEPNSFFGSEIMRKIVYFDFIAFSVLCLFRMYFVVLSSCRDKEMRERKILFFIQPGIFF